MRFLFIDETDRQKANHGKRIYFVLCGLTVEASNLLNVTAGLNKILERHRITSLKEARRGGLNQLKKSLITNEIFRVLEKHGAEVRATYLGELTTKTSGRISETYFGALDFLIERFFLFLKKKGEAGLVVLDSCDKAIENDLKKRFFTYIQEEGQVWMRAPGTVNPYRARICPWLVFSEDTHSVILQATDLIASALNDAIWKSISEGELDVEKLPEKNSYLKVYWPLFAKSSTDRVSGWGVKIWN